MAIASDVVFVIFFIFIRHFINAICAFELYHFVFQQKDSPARLPLLNRRPSNAAPQPSREGTPQPNPVNIQAGSSTQAADSVALHGPQPLVNCPNCGGICVCAPTSNTPWCIQCCMCVIVGVFVCALVCAGLLWYIKQMFPALLPFEI